MEEVTLLVRLVGLERCCEWAKRLEVLVLVGEVNALEVEERKLFEEKDGLERETWVVRKTFWGRVCGLLVLFARKMRMDLSPTRKGKRGSEEQVSYPVVFFRLHSTRS